MRIGAIALIIVLLVGSFAYFMTSEVDVRPLPKPQSEEKRAYKELSAKIRSENPREAVQAIELAISLNTPEGFALLETAATRHDRLLRLSLLTASKRIPKANAGRVIARILDDQNIALQNEAIKTLETISGKNYNLTSTTLQSERASILFEAKNDALALK